MTKQPSVWFPCMHFCIGLTIAIKLPNYLLLLPCSKSDSSNPRRILLFKAPMNSLKLTSLNTLSTVKGYLDPTFSKFISHSSACSKFGLLFRGAPGRSSLLVCILQNPSASSEWVSHVLSWLIALNDSQNNPRWMCISNSIYFGSFMLWPIVEWAVSPKCKYQDECP